MGNIENNNNNLADKKTAKTMIIIKNIAGVVLVNLIVKKIKICIYTRTCEGASAPVVYRNPCLSTRCAGMHCETSAREDWSQHAIGEVVSGPQTIDG